jgi:hypothetical protein
MMVNPQTRRWRTRGMKMTLFYFSGVIQRRLGKGMLTAQKEQERTVYLEEWRAAVTGNSDIV